MDITHREAIEHIKHLAWKFKDLVILENFLQTNLLEDCHREIVNQYRIELLMGFQGFGKSSFISKLKIYDQIDIIFNKNKSYGYRLNPKEVFQSRLLSPKSHNTIPFQGRDQYDGLQLIEDIFYLGVDPEYAQLLHDNEKSKVDKKFISCTKAIYTCLNRYYNTDPKNSKIKDNQFFFAFKEIILMLNGEKDLFEIARFYKHSANNKLQCWLLREILVKNEHEAVIDLPRARFGPLYSYLLSANEVPISL